MKKLTTYKNMKTDLIAEGYSSKEASEMADAKFKQNQLLCDRCQDRPAKWTSGSYHFYWCDECHYD